MPGFDRPLGYHIRGKTQRGFNAIRQDHEIQADVGIDLHQDIDIAFRIMFTPRHRAKQGQGLDLKARRPFGFIIGENG